MESGNCNSKELYDIINKISPEIIFEEYDISRIDNEYYKNGHYKYQKTCSLETAAIMNYLENHQIIHIPVDTYEVINFPEDMYPKISNNNEEYNNLVKKNYILTSQYGFPYLNSKDCIDLLDKIKITEEIIVKKLNDTNLTNTYNSWKLITDNRENEMVKNIYNYSQNHNFSKAVFITGAEHKKSIIKKIQKYEMNGFKLNWEYEYFENKI
jgi:DNA-binding protein Fis